MTEGDVSDRVFYFNSQSEPYSSSRVLRSLNRFIGQSDPELENSDGTPLLLRVPRPEITLPENSNHDSAAKSTTRRFDPIELFVEARPVRVSSALTIDIENQLILRPLSCTVGGLAFLTGEGNKETSCWTHQQGHRP